MVSVLTMDPAGNTVGLVFDWALKTVIGYDIGVTSLTGSPPPLCFTRVNFFVSLGRKETGLSLVQSGYRQITV